MTRKIEFVFSGNMRRCKILYCTISSTRSPLCRCDICKDWGNRETIKFRDLDGWTYGCYVPENPQQIKVFPICPRQIIIMSLVPIDDVPLINSKRLRCKVFGSDLGRIWTDDLYGIGYNCSVKIRVYDPTNPRKVANIANWLQIDFTGYEKCKVVFTIWSDCRCETCRMWRVHPKAIFLDQPDTGYASFTFGPGKHTKRMELCRHQTISMGLAPLGDGAIRRVGDLSLTINGRNVGSIWKDEVEIGGKRNNIRVEVYATD
ncbi:hypothetical protein BGZ99_006321 [Dissophora globulifera]|uniref:Uncharacterized protein n=1 Tax=Dissophora globulifera TaxID=979702 RepID=A0A9P6US65_9FUNG|nr:hypothetical protein BGZ99_006321 [Dissophora globulifera]